MTAYTGAIYTGPTSLSGTGDSIEGNIDYKIGTITTTFYTMRAVDNNAGTTPPTYRIWRVANTPDYTASQYNGPYSGGSINFSSIAIIDVTEVVK